MKNLKTKFVKGAAISETRLYDLRRSLNQHLTAHRKVRGFH